MSSSYGTYTSEITGTSAGTSTASYSDVTSGTTVVGSGSDTSVATTSGEVTGVNTGTYTGVSSSTLYGSSYGTYTDSSSGVTYSSSYGSYSGTTSGTVFGSSYASYTDSTTGVTWGSSYGSYSGTTSGSVFGSSYGTFADSSSGVTYGSSAGTYSGTTSSSFWGSSTGTFTDSTTGTKWISSGATYTGIKTNTYSSSSVGTYTDASSVSFEATAIVTDTCTSTQAASESALVTQSGTDVVTWINQSTNSSINSGTATSTGSTASSTTTAGTSLSVSSETMIDHAPSASSASINAMEGRKTSYDISSLVSDPDSWDQGHLQYSFGEAAHGQVSISNSQLTYTPADGYAGPDSIAFTATDIYGLTASAVLSIQVLPITISISFDAVDMDPVNLVRIETDGLSKTLDLAAAARVHILVSAPAGFDLAGYALTANSSLGIFSTDPGEQQPVTLIDLSGSSQTVDAYAHDDAVAGGTDTIFAQVVRKITGTPNNGANGSNNQPDPQQGDGNNPDVATEASATNEKDQHRTYFSLSDPALAFKGIATNLADLQVTDLIGPIFKQLRAQVEDGKFNYMENHILAPSFSPDVLRYDIMDEVLTQVEKAIHDSIKQGLSRMPMIGVIVDNPANSYLEPLSKSFSVDDNGVTAKVSINTLGLEGIAASNEFGTFLLDPSQANLNSFVDYLKTPAAYVKDVGASFNWISTTNPNQHIGGAIKLGGDLVPQFTFDLGTITKRGVSVGITITVSTDGIEGKGVIKF